jgi:predicted RecA/RadA family phage recombinase
MPNVLRTATPMGDWRSFKFTCGDSGGWYGAKNAYRNGQSWLYVVGDSVGALLEDAEFGEEGVLVYHAEKIIVPKETDSGSAFDVGDVVYMDPVSRLVTPAQVSAHYRIGICTEPALATDTLVEIDLDGAGARVRP